MTATLRLRVRYPVAGATLTVRTAASWESDILPVKTHVDGAEFDVTFDTPFVELKACLAKAGELHWSVGDNYVLSANDPDPEIWPAFFVKPRGEVSELFHVTDEKSGRSHAVRVYTPPGYSENTLRTYPVLYMQDGKNLFHADEAFGGQEWRVDETMDRLDQMSSVRKIIVVGVTPHDRMKDYTTPGYEEYGRFLTEVIKPTVDERFRTRPGAEHTVVSGSSLGGVVSLYLAWRYPDVFGGAMCMSSTFGYQDDLFTRIAAEPRPAIRIYLDSGWPRDNFDATNAMRDLLVARGFVLGTDVMSFSFPEGKHTESSWADRLHVPFQFFFGRAWAASRAKR